MDFIGFLAGIGFYYMTQLIQLLGYMCRMTVEMFGAILAKIRDMIIWVLELLGKILNLIFEFIKWLFKVLYIKEIFQFIQKCVIKACDFTLDVMISIFKFLFIKIPNILLDSLCGWLAFLEIVLKTFHKWVIVPTVYILKQVWKVFVKIVTKTYEIIVKIVTIVWEYTLKVFKLIADLITYILQKLW